MSDVQVKINSPQVSAILPSSMPSCVPFIARRKDNPDEQCVLIRTGSLAYVFFEPSMTNRVSFTSGKNYKWVDENYEVIEGVTAEVTLKV